MSSIDYQTDPRLPNNVVIAQTPGGGVYSVERGINDDGQRGITITDMEADHEDERVTELEYVFIQESGIYVHILTTLHRHGPESHHPDEGDGACEQAPVDEAPAPDVVTDIVAEQTDAPVATADGVTGGEDSE